MRSGLNGEDVPEGLLDAMVTVTTRYDLQKTSGPRNSRSSSIYVVKPKDARPRRSSLCRPDLCPHRNPCSACRMAPSSWG